MIYKNSHFVLDTSALLFDPSVLTYFEGNSVYIPVSVLEELDGHKDRLDEVGSNARSVNRSLYAFKKEGDLLKGVKDRVSKVSIYVKPENLDDIPDSLKKESNDNRILSVALTLRKNDPKIKVYLITNDFNLALKAEAYGVSSFSFEPETKYVKTEYKGHRELEEATDLCINEVYSAGFIDTPKRLKAQENEYFLIKNPISKASVFCVNKENFLHLRKFPKEYECFGIQPLNNEQKFAIDLLLDPKIKLVTLTGLAGSGKTLISVAAGLAQTLEHPQEYDRLVISRSLVLLSGKDKLGFLKGGVQEKLAPYLLPLKDAIDQLMPDSDAFDYLTATNFNDPDSNGSSSKSKPKIEIEPLQYIRGRSLRDVYFIIDESQNLTLNEVKTIVSRAGEGTKIILLGDLHQIDNPYISKSTNGLAQVIERFKDSKIAGHISLREGVRSALATEAAEKL